MKFSTIITGTFAALAAAAPVEERNKNADFSAFNNFGSIASNDIAYLVNFNQLDFSQIVNLANINGFNIGGFQSLFQSNEFNLQQLLALQQLQTLIQFSSLGVLGGFDLSTLALQSINLGLVSNIGSVDFGQFVNQANLAQIQLIAAQSFVPSNFVLIAKE